MDNTSSGTEECAVDRYEDIYYNAFYLTLITVIACVSIVGNVLVIIVMLRTPKLRTPSNYFFINLGFSDLMQGILYPVYNIGQMPYFELAKSMCKYMGWAHFARCHTNQL